MASSRVSRVPRLAVVASLLVLALCIASAVSIYWEQAAEQRTFRAKAANRAIVGRLQTELRELAGLLPTGTGQQVRAAHERIEDLLARARELTDTEEERTLADQVQGNFDRYRQDWEQRRAAAKASEKVPVADLVAELLRDSIPLCHRWRELDFLQIEKAETAHARSMQRMAWGLGIIGVVSSLAALLLGHYAARGVRQSLHQLSVHVRVATEKLSQTLPTVTITENGDLQRLHEQMQGLTGEIDKAVERLQQREREALRAEQLAAVGQVAAGVAHELRNPLTSIKLLLHAHRQEAEAHGLPVEDFDVVEQEIRRMDQCLQTFLDFARPPRAVRRPLDLVPVVERALALIGGRARKQKVSVRFAHAGAPCVVEADGEQIVQVLVNLGLNALDVMPRGGRLEVELAEPEGGQVVLRVLDTGPGLSPQVSPRLFEPFASGKETGLGLGLAISRRIAESHGGSLRARNRPEGGAWFELCLPARATTPVESV
jgi:C4-dicarboxylate-specific signal transduction histidine kinase